MKAFRSVVAQICRPDSGAATFFTGILLWGIGMGAFNAVFHNFVVEVYHVVTVFYDILGGWIFDAFGPGVLFASAAVMALCNSAFALSVPKPQT